MLKVKLLGLALLLVGALMMAFDLPGGARLFRHGMHATTQDAIRDAAELPHGSDAAERIIEDTRKR